MSGKQYATAYTAHVRVTVRAGEVLVVREGFGAGKGRAATPGEAHEMALKCAETDATKRALATFGNRFGLALYDPEHAGVRQPKTEGDPMSWTLKTASGEPNAAFEKPTEFAVALRKAMSEAPDIERLFALWEQNVDAVRCLNKTLDQRHLKNSGVASQLVEHLKRCAVDLATPCKGSEENVQPTRPSNNAASRPKVDKSALAISEPKRIRCKQHLRFVAREPCVICGRQPTHAHHLRHAQPRGLGLKVSDEFTVPLCAIHHNDVHRVGMEKTSAGSKMVPVREPTPLGICRRSWRRPAWYLCRPMRWQDPALGFESPGGQAFAPPERKLKRPSSAPPNCLQPCGEPKVYFAWGCLPQMTFCLGSARRYPSHRRAKKPGALGLLSFSS
jgi:hypothetical protein